MRLQKQLFVFALCLCLLVVVSAHPGRTDSQGGHYVSGTGEYHYHHGYSAHEHYDKDGDGVLDCPYTFSGKPNSSGNHSGSYTIKNKSPSDKAESSKDDTEPVKNDTPKDSDDYIWLWVIICCITVYGVPLLINELKWRFKK